MAEAKPEDPLLRWQPEKKLNPAIGYSIVVGGMTLVASSLLSALVLPKFQSDLASSTALTAYFAFWLGCIGAGFLFGYLYGRRTVIELRVETEDTGKTLTLHSWNGKIHRVPLPEIEDVHVTRNTAGSPPVLSIKVYAGYSRYWTTHGPNADALMNTLRSSGVKVVTRDRKVSDDD